MTGDEELTRLTPTQSKALVGGDRIGPYRLVRELGRGGMGTVYLAVRNDDQFQKRVAIKVLRRGMDSEAIVRRFRRERQILASLQHPYIGSLLDGGTTDDGLPYFAMEYIEGQPIGAYCDARNLTISARLELFRKVCTAVQHAHQNLVIHRDIKPANVLVTADGSPKLLDFGIAKLLNPEMGGTTLAPTAAGLQLMTPEYASPEQVRGEAVTTATDVYSLGVLLYELLTGRQPYMLTSRAPADVARIVAHAVPLAPSTAVVQPAGGDETTGAAGAEEIASGVRRPLPLRRTPDRIDRLRRRLSGDLDNIVLKALSKEPERRYVSVDQLSEDIHRHLNGLPVLARKDTVRYRAAKFVLRHRRAAVAAALVFVTLVAAVVVATSQARVASRERARAEQRFEDVRQLANAFLFEVHDAIRDLPGSTEARRLLVSRGLEYLDKLAADTGNRADLRGEIAHAYVRVGDVQGRPLVPNLGDTAGAAASYQKALTLFESLDAARSPDPGLRRAIATAHLRMSAIRSATGDSAQALAAARQGLTALREIPGDAARDADVRRDLVMAHSLVGDLLSATGDTQGALAARRVAVETMEALAALAPDQADNLRQLGIAYQKLGNTLGNPNYPNVGDHHGALQQLERSGEVFRRAADLFPHNAAFRRNAAVIDSNTADLLTALDRPAEALVRQQRALAEFQALADADPANRFAPNDVAISLSKIGQLLEVSGRFAEAVAAHQRALAIHQTLAASDPANDGNKQEIASDFGGLATALAKHGDRARSLSSHARAISLSRELQAANADNVELQVAVALALIGRADSLVRFRLPSDAARDYTEAVAILERLHEAGALEGTDVRTLDDARATLRRLTTTIGL